MNKLILALAIGCSLIGSGCKKEQAERATALSMAHAVTPSEASEASPASQAPGSSVVTQSRSNASGAGMGNQKQRFPSFLSAEMAVIESGGLSVDKVAPIIQTEMFSKFIDRLAAEAATDPLAQEVAVAERARLDRQLKGQAHLREFACGLSVCAGSIYLGSNTAVYDSMVDNFITDGTQAGTFLDHRFDLGSGKFEHRFVMSLDPEISGITGRISPPG